jgi:hypothetical protein
VDRQYVGIDFYRRRSVIARTNAAGEKLSSVRVPNDLTLVYYGLRDGEIRCLANAA